MKEQVLFYSNPNLIHCYDLILNTLIFDSLRKAIPVLCINHILSSNINI